MVNRLDKGAKFTRWAVYFKPLPPVASWKNALKAVVESGYADVAFREISLHRVDLVWAHAVTYASAVRLCNLALQRREDMELAGEPVGVADEGQVDVHEAPPPTRRIRKKTRAVITTGDSADEAGCISGAGSISSSDACAVSAPPLECSSLLALKCENMVRRAGRGNAFPQHDYHLNFQSPFSVPEGNFGKFYSGTKGVGPILQDVAIKLFTPRDDHEHAAAADEAMAEVRRHVALRSSNPRIIQLVDVQLFSSSLIGLVFESFDTDLSSFLKTTSLTLPGTRHVLRSVLEALAYLHEAGLVHTQLEPAKIVLSGAAVRPSVRDQGADPEVPLEVILQLPSSFEVLFPLKHVFAGRRTNPTSRNARGLDATGASYMTGRDRKSVKGGAKPVGQPVPK